MGKDIKNISNNNSTNLNKKKNVQNLSKSFNQNNSKDPSVETEVTARGDMNLSKQSTTITSLTKTDKSTKKKNDPNTKAHKDKNVKVKVEPKVPESEQTLDKSGRNERLKSKVEEYMTSIFQKYEFKELMDEDNEEANEEEENEEVGQEWDRSGYFDRLSLIEEEIDYEEDEEEEEEKENDDEEEEEEEEVVEEEEEEEEKDGEEDGDEEEEEGEEGEEEEEEGFDDDNEYGGSESSSSSKTSTESVLMKEIEDEEEDGEEQEGEVEETDSEQVEQILDEEDEETKERNKYYHGKRNELNNLSNGDLQAKTNDFEMQEKILQIENYMFECYLEKIFAVKHKKKRKMSKQEYKINLFTKRVTMAKATLSGYDNKNINISQRLEIVEEELKTLKTKIRNETTRAINVIKHASFDVIDLSRQLVSLTEKIKKFDELVESNTNVTKGTGKPKDVLKLWQEEIQKLETRILKYRLKKVALKLHLSKMQSLSNQAEETNEILSENDINLLKIGNQILSRNIKAGNENLLVLKITAGKMRLKLNSLKAKLIEAEKVSNQMASKITMANDQAEKSMAEINHNTKDLSRIKKQIQHIYQYINAYSVPEVIEYAKFVENLPPLERQIKHYGRKIEVKKAEIKKKEKAIKNLSSSPKKNDKNKCLY